jgi:hypothetical protein
MCIPILGAVMGMMGSVMSAAGSAQAANAQAEQQEMAALTEKINARSRMQESITEGDRVSSKFDTEFGKQRAAFAKAGVNPTSGSALRIWEETAGDQYQDVATTEHNKISQATAHENKARDHEAQAKNYRQAASTSFLTGIVGGLGGLAKGGGGGFGSALQIG